VDRHCFAAPLRRCAVRSSINETYSAKAGDIQHDWFVVDAEDKTLGRLATEIAHRLRGKHKPEYTPHMDMGDYIVVVNCEKIRVTGAKRTDKQYYHHTGFPGGIKSASFEKLIDRAPERVIQRAVKGMMPRSPLGRAMLKKLKVYAGPAHPHAAQQPQPLTV
jgi:large subunit ribosomal protein L13